MRKKSSNRAAIQGATKYANTGANIRNKSDNILQQPNKMTNFNEYETESERFNRQRNENIVEEYLSRSCDIVSGKVSPHRLCAFLGERFNMSRYGVTLVLKRAGVYKNAKQPVVVPKNYSKKITLSVVTPSVQTTL